MIDRHTLRPIGEWDHVLQSIGMILTTPCGRASCDGNSGPNYLT
ncbi:hypothetical protein ACFSYD_11890 [Paracoccus aerius]